MGGAAGYGLGTLATGGSLGFDDFLAATVNGAMGGVASFRGMRVCFVAGTPIVGPWGSKAIEEFKDYETHGDACDTLVSRDEFNDDGVLTIRRVLRRFERIGLVLDVTVNGRVIGTTHEHPFFVRDKGWTKAQELRVGDEVRLMQPGWVTVEAVTDTGRLATVYNLEIEDDHTYFVGCDEWGFAVWAHNDCIREQFEAALAEAGIPSQARGQLWRSIAGEGALTMPQEQAGALLNALLNPNPRGNRKGLTEPQAQAVLAAAGLQRVDRTAGSVPVGTKYEPLKGSVPFELLFNRGKGKDALPIADVQRQLQMQVNEANRLIHEAPVTPLVSWQRMRAQMELYEAAARGDKAARLQVKQIEAEAQRVRNAANAAADRSGVDRTGLHALHPLDAGLGGYPGTIAGYGNGRVNTMMGGNVQRSRWELLAAVTADVVPNFTGRYNPNS